MNSEPTRTYYVVRDKMGRQPIEHEFFTYAEAAAQRAADDQRYPSLAPSYVVRCDVYESGVS